MSVSPTGDPQVGKLIDLIRSLDTVKRRLNGNKKNTKSLYLNACPFVLLSLLLPLLVLPPLYCFSQASGLTSNASAWPLIFTSYRPFPTSQFPMNCVCTGIMEVGSGEFSWDKPGNGFLNIRRPERSHWQQGGFIQPWVVGFFMTRTYAKVGSSLSSQFKLTRSLMFSFLKMLCMFLCIFMFWPVSGDLRYFYHVVK